MLLHLGDMSNLLDGEVQSVPQSPGLLAVRIVFGAGLSSEENQLAVGRRCKGPDRHCCFAGFALGEGHADLVEAGFAVVALTGVVTLK